MRSKFYSLFIVLLAIIYASCTKPNNYANYEGEVIEVFEQKLLATNENHPPAIDADTGRLKFLVFNNNSIRFDVLIDSLTESGDQITNIYLQLGDPVTDGPVWRDLRARISGSYASGIITDLSPGFIDSLRDDGIHKYINVITANYPNGRVRGQLGNKIIYSKSAELRGSSNVPPVNTLLHGTTYLRLTEDSVLYSRIVMDNLSTADPVTSAGLYEGAIGSGALLTMLAADPSHFDVSQSFLLNAGEVTSLLTNPHYVRVNTVNFPNGKIAGMVE